MFLERTESIACAPKKLFAVRTAVHSGTGPSLAPKMLCSSARSRISSVLTSKAPSLRSKVPLNSSQHSLSSYSLTHRSSRLNLGSSYVSRLYAARTKKYEPKYKEAEAKGTIVPSRRLLDPTKERKMPVRRADLAFNESELGSAVFEAFDLDMGARAIDPEQMSDAEIETLVLKQKEREERFLADSEAAEKPKAESPKVSKTTLLKALSKSKDTRPAITVANTNDSKKYSSSSGAGDSETVSGGSNPQRKPLIAIVGRPNVGKSTLFNRLIRKSKSLITNTAGTTRDRKYGFSSWEDYEMMFVDTGGMLGDDPWSESITEQAEVAISEADFIIMLADFVDGVTETDRQLARRLRKSSKPTIVAINKCDNEERIASDMSSFQQLGLGEPFPLSASHGHGTAELLDAIISPLAKLGFKPKSKNGEDEEIPTFPISKDKLVTSGAFHADGTRKEIRVALVGVPNVGKSSLLNQILGSKRSVVSDRPGTTTDPIDQKISWKNEFPITIVDTAGVRKKKSQDGHVEKLSALWSLKVVESSHVSILLLDAEAGAQAQDVRLSSYIIDNYRSCIVVVNKWDLAPDRSIIGMQAYEEQLRERLQFWYYVPVVFASAKTGFNVDSIMAWVVRVSDERRIHLATRKLFQILDQAAIIKLPPASGKQRVKFRYCTQVNLGGSPTFIFFVNHPDLVDAPYKRFLEGFIRQNYAFTGTPIRLMFRKNAAVAAIDREKRKAAQRAKEAPPKPKNTSGKETKAQRVIRRRRERESQPTLLDELAPRFPTGEESNPNI